MYINNKIVFTSGKTPPADRRLLTFWVDNTKKYSEKLSLFLEISACNILIIDNRHAPLNVDQSLEICQAMLHGKHIIILDTPQFAHNVSLFIRHLILNRLNKILVSDITMFDDIDLSNYLASLDKNGVNYALTKHETILVKSMLRQLFRNLVS